MPASDFTHNIWLNCKTDSQQVFLAGFRHQLSQESRFGFTSMIPPDVEGTDISVVVRIAEPSLA